MNMATKIIILLWKLWFYLLTAILVILIGFLWVYPLSFFSKSFHIAYKGIRLWAILVFYGSGFRLKVERKDKLEKNKPHIFIANHTSIIDIMVMAIIHKNHPVVFVGKEELANIPIFGTIYKRICIVVNRKDIKSRTHVYTLAKERIMRSENIVIFPEGGIPDDKSIVLDRFKDGAFTIAVSSKTPIVVYTIKGLKEMFPDKFWEGFPGKVLVRQLEIIDTDNLSLDDKDKIKRQAFDIMYNDLNLNS